MITKERFVKEWQKGTVEERIKLADTLADSDSFKAAAAKYHIDGGCTMFTGTLGELVILKFLEENRIDVAKDPSSDLIRQRGDDFKGPHMNENDFYAYSQIYQKYVKIEVKTSSWVCVDIFNLIKVPQHILDKAQKQGAKFVFLIDNLSIDKANQDRNSFSYGTLHPSNCASSHIILINMETGEKKIVADFKKVYDLIKSILDFLTIYH